MDLCLIQLPNPALQHPSMYMPLGILYIAAVVEKEGYKVEVLDLRDGYKPLPDACFYGFSCTTPEINEAKRLSKWIRISGKRTIVGGAHSSLLPEDCDKQFDYIVMGEGEDVIIPILRGEINKGRVRAKRLLKLDNIPYPAWKKLDAPFSDTLFPGEGHGTGDKAATLIASRGCPWSCSFCGNLFQHPIRFRSVENIIGEIKELKKLGITYFRFEDDNFTIHPSFEDLCYALEELHISYKCHTRSDMLSPRLAQFMKMSGCEECGLGVESADDVVLKINKKYETAEQHKEAVRILKCCRIRAKTYWMAGLPGETDETLELNNRFMRETQPDKWTLSCFTPYPGCEIYNYPDKFGIEIINKNWSTWWNFVIQEKHITLKGREGFNHVLIGQTVEQMTERHNKFRDFLEGEEWKRK